MKGFRFHAEAIAEIASALEHLREVAPPFADKFLDEIELGLEQIERFPAMGGRTFGGFRRWLLRRFPFGLIHRESGSTIFVVAVAHTRRAPGYWLARSHEGDEVHEDAAIQQEERQVVELDSDAEADQIFAVLMSDPVNPRREFIEQHALNVGNLGV